MADRSKKDTGSADAKAQRAADGKSAMAEYQAEAAAMRAKTERLRALRLAREAASPPSPPKAAAGSGKKAGTKAGKKTPAAKLASWLTSQERSGRKT
jgi:hypothetical protein